MIKEALLYEKLDRGRVRCNLCAHRCVIPEGRTGVCRVRKNRGGNLYTLVYGHTISQMLDPIEKKPLYHVLPDSWSFSIATPGCNFHCRWCQNWEIVHREVPDHGTYGRRASPQQLVSAAQGSQARSIAYTYTEPTVFFEYALDTAKIAHREGLLNLYITNGYMTPEMLEAFSPYLDAANVDLKAFREETYQRYVGASLKPILQNLKLMKELGIWVEVTTLVIPALNDDREELREAAQFIFDELGPETPWHLSRFFPRYQLQDRPPTPLDTLRRAQRIGRDVGLEYVYLGNVVGEANTRCPACGRVVINRRGFGSCVNYLDPAGRCPACGRAIAGLWKVEKSIGEGKKPGPASSSPGE